MTHKPPRPQEPERQVRAYNSMLEHVKDLLLQAEDKTLAGLQLSIDKAKDTAVELGELTLDEADLLATWLRRDLEEAGNQLAETGSELREWLHFDVSLVEDRLWEMLATAADQTKLAYLNLAHHAQRASEYHTGEIAAVGTLRCNSCGELLHFHASGHIPPCPRCHNTRYSRSWRNKQPRGMPQDI